MPHHRIQKDHILGDQKTDSTEEALRMILGAYDEEVGLPDEMPHFPLRDLAPDAASYLAKAGHFSARDLKFLVDHASLDADPRNPLEVYSALLDIIETYPWMQSSLEVETAHNRHRHKHGRNTPRPGIDKIFRYIEKFPMEKLRLENRPDMQDRLGEFFGPDSVPTDLWVAAFFEYCVARMGQLAFGADAQEANLIHSVVVGEISLVHDLDKVVARIRQTGDWAMLAELLKRTSLRALGENDFDADILHCLRQSISVFAEAFDADGDPAHFSRIAEISEIAADYAALQDTPDLETILDRLEGLGLNIDRDHITLAQLAPLDDPQIRGAAFHLSVSRDELPRIKARQDALDEEIAQATRERDFQSARALMDEAETIGRQIAGEAALRATMQEIVDLALAGNGDALATHLSGISPPTSPDQELAIIPRRKGVASTPVHNAAKIPDQPGTKGSVPSGDDHDATTQEEISRDLASTEEGPGTAVAAATETAAAPESQEASPEPEETAVAQGAEPADEALPDQISAREDAGADSEVAKLEGTQVAEGPEETGSDTVSTSDVSGKQPDAAASQARAAGASAPEHDDVMPLISPAHLTDLISRDLIGIAAEAADAIESAGHSWPVSHDALKVAAASRTPHRGYGPEAQAFLDIAGRALIPRNDESAVMTLGALLPPCVTEHSPTLRAPLPDLARGALGPHLLPVAEAVAGLDYDFPPGPDKLAEISGARLVPQKQRILDRLTQWREMISAKTSRWPFATQFMHHVSSDAGLIGRAIRDILNNSPHASGRARHAIETLSDTNSIEDRAVEYAVDIGRPTARLHPRGLEYLHRQFDEALILLDEWIKAHRREGSNSQRSDERLRAIIGNLRSRITRSIEGLEVEARKSDLTGAIAGWLVDRLRETLSALGGEDTGAFATLKDALTAEHDLIPTDIRLRLADPDARIDMFSTLFENARVQAPDEAYRAATLTGAFETALSLAIRYDLGGDEKVKAEAASFAAHWRGELERRERRLKALAKVDYAHQQEIDRRLDWCRTALKNLAALEAGEETADLAEIPDTASELDRIADLVEASIREDQADRIRQYRTELNSEDADTLLEEVSDLPLETGEDRIAQLRDGRFAATMETDLEGAIAAFTPGFVNAASAPVWPGSVKAYAAAFAADGPLYTEEDRRGPAEAFLVFYKEVCRSAMGGSPSATKLRDFFEEIGFENIRLSGMTSLGRPKAWTMRLTGRIVSDGWFLPPTFGSKASNFRLFVIGPDTLPEAIQKALDPDLPTIILVAGVADLARRHEFAERLRANAIPALFIDEALVAFAATRRETRARTVFECGLPYGRFEPYTTDAGQIPAEMFFGREAEIRDILSKTADGCLVYGGRQLGKSALLSHISTTRHTPQEDRIIVRRDVKSLGNAENTSAIWGHLNGMLSDHGVVRSESRTADDVCRDIRAWLSTRPEGRVICLFDETDHFMATETRADYPELGRLKELMEDTGRAFKVVFAGLHNVKRMHRQPNSPLAHLGQPICIGPLNRTQDDKRAAYKLVVDPMRAAGFRFETMESVEEILAWANYYPSLVQEYAKGLLATLHGAGSGKSYRLSSDGPLWVIPRDELFNHRNFQQIEARIREKFHLTLDLDPRYALVAYTLAWLNAEGNELKARTLGFTPDELLEQARVFWPRNSEQPSPAAFDVLLDELFELGVIGKVPVPGTDRARYCLRSRQVAAMLGSHDDIEHALLNLREKDPAVSYDRAIHRRRYSPTGANGQDRADDGVYSSLTDLEIERLLSDHDNATRLVCGLPALGLGKVGTALKRLAGEGQLPAHRPEEKIEVEATDTVKAFTAAVGRARSGRIFRVLVHTPSTAREARDVLGWLEKGRSPVMDGCIRPILLLDATDPEMREIALRRRDQSEYLKPWAGDMIRVHLHNIEATPLDTPDDRKRILEKTGGIPSDTTALIRKLRFADDKEAVYADWSSPIPVPADIAEGELGQMLDYMDGEIKDGNYEALDDILRDAFHKDLVTIGPDLLATAMVSLWQPKQRQIRRSALGTLVAKLRNSR